MFTVWGCGPPTLTKLCEPNGGWEARSREGNTPVGEAEKRIGGTRVGPDTCNLILKQEDHPQAKYYPVTDSE